MHIDTGIASPHIAGMGASAKARFVKDRQGTARAYVQQVADARRWTPTEIARLIGVGASTLTRLVNKADLTYAPKLENLMKISEVSGIPLPLDLRSAYGVSRAKKIGPDEDEPSSVSVAPEISLNTSRNIPDSIPVFGTARGGSEGSFDLNLGEPLEWRSRPASLRDKGEVFGLYVESDSMSPRYDSGELILVWRHRPVIIGRDLVIQMKPHEDGVSPRAYLKRLVSRNSEAITVEQFNPAKRRVFKLAEIESLHLVLLRSEMV